VMQRGQVVESGLTDQVLDDPRHAYTQLLVSSVLQT
jgi:putative phosphonate transport system ATP-binding protein